MAKRTRQHLENIKKFVEFSHGTSRNTLQVFCRGEWEKGGGDLAYCYKYRGPNQTVYRVEHWATGVEDLDFRILLHEYGHIYLGHLDEVYAELDREIYDLIESRREELADMINRECGIDFGEDLLERVLDDPSINHQIHNIAMDMEVNSKVLSPDDTKEISTELGRLTVKDQVEALDELIEGAKTKEEKESYRTIKDVLTAQEAVKLILPEDYHVPGGDPFPDELSYTEYLIMIIQNLDQFVKMMASLSLRGTTSTEGITPEDIKGALQGGQSGGNCDGKNPGGQGGIRDLDDLMESLGLSNGPSSEGEKEGDGKTPGSGAPGKGDPKDKDKDSTKKDHQSDAREEADQEREEAKRDGKKYSGRGLSGTAGTTLKITPSDPIEMALESVIQEFKSKVVQWTTTRDLMWNWNRGINRTLLCPAYKSKVSVSTEPTVVFLIDVSGSMDSSLVNRCVGTIRRKMKKIRGGLKYNIITWSTQLEEHLRNLDPRRPAPNIRIGGGTSLAYGIKYFRDNYDKQALLIVISDLEDDLDEWSEQTSQMSGYTMYAFDYGYRDNTGKVKGMKIKHFKN